MPSDRLERDGLVPRRADRRDSRQRLRPSPPLIPGALLAAVATTTIATTAVPAASVTSTLGSTPAVTAAALPAGIASRMHLHPL